MTKKDLSIESLNLIRNIPHLFIKGSYSPPIWDNTFCMAYSEKYKT